MTKEELKQEIHNYIATQCSAMSINTRNRLVYHYIQMEMVGEFVYNLEEKQIEIDAEQIRALQKQNGELTDKVNELEAQLEREKNLNQCLSDHNEQLRELIEKMKCCENCKYYNNHYNEVVCKRQVINCKRILRQATRDQWEIKEK